MQRVKLWDAALQEESEDEALPIKGPPTLPAQGVVHSSMFVEFCTTQQEDSAGICIHKHRYIIYIYMIIYVCIQLSTEMN